MTTREDFEREWAVAGMPKDKQRLADAAWQACAAHYEATINTLNDAITEEGIMAKMYADLEAERNALLALIAEKDKALIEFICADTSYQIACQTQFDQKPRAAARLIEAKKKAESALSLTHDSVRLKEIGQAVRIAMHNHTTMATFDSVEVPVGAKLWTNKALYINNINT